MSANNSKHTTRRRRGCGCFPGVGLFLLVVILIAGILHFVAQAQLHKAIVAAYPPPAEMLDVNGLQMHINCIGEGRQTIVVETDMLNNSVIWQDFQQRLAVQARVCVYDRAGRAWSQASWSSRSAEHINAELHALLKAAGIEPGFIILGDREGAVYARHYAWRYPDEVAGLVLVDDPWSAQSALGVPLMTEYGIGVITLLLNPTWTIPWWWQRETALQRWQQELCPAWMDEPACQRWRALSIDPLDMQTEALERFAIPTAMSQSQSPEIRFGDIDLLVVKSPSSNLSASDLDSVFSDLIARSSAAKLWLCPAGDGPVFDRNPDCIVDAARSLLH